MKGSTTVTPCVLSVKVPSDPEPLCTRYQIAILTIVYSDEGRSP